MSSRKSVKPPNAPSSSGASISSPIPRWRRVAIPEFETLRRLRDVLARGGRRVETPEDHARIAVFETIAALLRLLDRFKRRVECGESCGLRCIRHDSMPDRLVIEITIDVLP